MGAPFPPLDPTIHTRDSATITTEGPNAAKPPVLSATAAKPAMETTQLTVTMTPLQKLEARLIRNQQIAEALLSMKPQTPVNIPLLTDLLKIHPNQNFAANLTAGLAQGFFGSARVAKATASLKQLKTFLQPINIPFSLKKTSWEKLNLAALQALSNPPPPPSQTFRSIPLGWFQKRIAKKWRTIFHLPSPKGPLKA